MDFVDTAALCLKQCVVSLVTAQPEAQRGLTEKDIKRGTKKRELVEMRKSISRRKVTLLSN